MMMFALTFESPIDQPAFDALFDFLPQGRRTKIERFLRRPDAERALLAESMVRYVLMSRFGMDAKTISFHTNQFGKPQVVGSPVHYNISHSGNWVVCGFDDKPLGVDVEEVKRISLDIAHRFFSPDEYGYIMSQPVEKRDGAFFDLWTIKESVIKAEGKGLSMPLDSFTITIDGDRVSIGPELFSSTWFLKRYPIEEGYRCAVCCMKNEFPHKLERLYTDHIVEVLKK